VNLFKRFNHQAEESERIAYSLAHAGFTAVRALESLALFGVDISESEAQASQTRTPNTVGDVDDALARLRFAAARRRATYSDIVEGATLTGTPDEQGEQQIGFDVAAMDAMTHTAALECVALLGEEDEFRTDQGDGAARRGERLKSLMESELPFAIVDPLDGSNQAAGMGNRSGWAACAMVRVPGNASLASAVLLGDGRGFTSGSDGIWVSESTHPDREVAAYRLEPRLGPTAFTRPHFVIPASKWSTVSRAKAIMDADPEIKWISPLAGNPGLLTGMLAAGAVCGMQPEAFAWDHMASLMLASAGFPVMRASDETLIDPIALTELLLTDMAQGRMTETLYVGRTLDWAARLRDADARSLENARPTH